MTDERAYRVHLRFEAGGEKFVARAPELDLSADGPTRAEAIAKLEQEIEARIQAAAGGETLPPPVDVKPVKNTIEVKLSQSLARELEFQASQDGITPDALAAGLIARGLGALEGRGGGQRRRGPMPSQRPEPASAEDREDAQPAEDPRAREQSRDRGERRDDRNDRGDRRGRGGGGDRRREGYRPELDDKANFLEYLRGLEKGGGGRGRR